MSAGQEKNRNTTQALSREPAVFEEIVRAYQRRVYSMALRMTGNPEDACDLTQEIFLEVYRSLPGFRGQSRFATWLYRIATSRAIDWWRRHRRNGERILSLESICEVSGDEGGEPMQVESPGPGPEDAAIQKDVSGRLWRLVAELPEAYRVPLILYHCQNLSYREIAEVLRLPVRTVETRLYRAKKMLRERLVRKEIKL